MMPYSMKFPKKSEDLYKISKNEGYFFGKHLLVEKSPTATIYIYHEYTTSQSSYTHHDWL